MHVVATAGHVDHGKSTLVLALTGTDPDRFAEEKARGLTIDLGFASVGDIAFVDVPGHIRFIKNMLAGVGAVDACLFVVDATEGWKPQSEEHLRILELLGVGHGVVALTKAGLVDDDSLVRLEVAERTAGTFLEGADIVAVDAVAGTGLDDLRAALDRMLSTTPTAVDRGRTRLWVDRSFAARGAGTVVTGTLTGGALSVGDDVLLLPSGLTARVRGLQSHGRALDRAEPGRRLAVNLAGVAHADVARGHALVRPDRWAPTTTVDCSLQVLPSVDHEVTRRGAYQAYIGSGEHAVALRVLGNTGCVRLHLPVPLPLLPGDRYVLRESGRGETVGGGEVLDVAPVLPAARARPSRDVDRVVAERGWVEADLLERLTGELRPATVGRWVAAPDALAAVEAHVREAVEVAGGLGLDVASLDERQRAVVERLPDLEVAEGRVRRLGTDDPLASHAYVAALEAAPFSPPPPDGVDRAELRELVRRGLVVERDGIYFAVSAVDRATEIVARLLEVSPDGITASHIREALGTSRKYTLPLLGHLDASGITRRRGDTRIPGPRLPGINPAKGSSW